MRGKQLPDMFDRFREMVAKAAFLPTRISLARTSLRSSREGPQTPAGESSGRVSRRFRPQGSTNISVQLRSLETKRTPASMWYELLQSAAERFRTPLQRCPKRRSDAQVPTTGRPPLEIRLG